jgi:DNA primase
VSLLVQKPALEAALAATIARFDEDPEGCFAEQTRLRKQLSVIEERLKAFGRRKAGEDPKDPSSHDGANKAA